MLVLIAIGWVVVLPALVLAGLLVGSKVLGARARRGGVIDVTALARELAGLADCDVEVRREEASLTSLKPGY